MSPRFLLLLGAACCWTSVAGSELEYTLSPTGVIVSPPNRYPGAEKVEGTTVFDYTYRDPSQTGSVIKVDCDGTHWIGIDYLVRKSGVQTLPKKTEHIRHEWTHSEKQFRLARLDHSHIKTFHRTETAQRDREMLRVKRKYKADGIWTLRTYVQDELVHEKGFELIGCNDPSRFLATPESPDSNELHVIDVPEAPKVAESHAEDPDKMICRREKITGSHRFTKVCRTRAQIDSRRESDRDMIRDIQRARGADRPPPE